jgi:hypothetical protein
MPASGADGVLKKWWLNRLVKPVWPVCQTGLTGSGLVQFDFALNFKFSPRISIIYPQLLFSIIHTLSWW